MRSRIRRTTHHVTNRINRKHTWMEDNDLIHQGKLTEEVTTTVDTRTQRLGLEGAILHETTTTTEMETSTTAVDIHQVDRVRRQGIPIKDTRSHRADKVMLGTQVMVARATHMSSPSVTLAGRLPGMLEVCLP